MTGCIRSIQVPLMYLIFPMRKIRSAPTPSASAGVLKRYIHSGISYLSGNTKGLGWTLIGSGFAASIAGGYFTLVGQNHLLTAVDQFNQQYKKSTVSLGFGPQSAGLVYKF